MFKGNYHRVKHMNGMAIYTSKLGNQLIIDTTPPHAMNEFEYAYKEYLKENPKEEDD